MQIYRKIEDIKFATQNVYGEEMEVSESIVMASAAGWYVGAICKDSELDGMISPFARYTDYFATPEEAERFLE
jgi:hypothetical protein